MKKTLIAVSVAVGLLSVASLVSARRTYTLEEIESMKKEGKLVGTERYVILGQEPMGSLTGKGTENASLKPASGKNTEFADADLIAYDKISNTRFLITMAREYYGNGDFWPYIYEENADQFGHPDRIAPGTMVLVPSLRKYGVNPNNPADVEKARRKGKEIYARYGKGI